MSKKERGRPMRSHQVRVIPAYRETPDMEKLGQALISIAVNIAEKQKSEQKPRELDTPTRSDSFLDDSIGRRAA